MSEALNTMATGAASCSPEWEEAVNLFLDGESDASEQPAMFSHLAECPDCRRRFQAVLAFRRLSRVEVVSVPPVVDAELMERLDILLKRRSDDGSDARSLWTSHARVGVARAAALVVGVFLLGVGMAHVSEPADIRVSAMQERVELGGMEILRHVEPVYVFYPGIIIEADRQTE